MPSEEESEEHYRRIMDVNLDAVVRLCQSVGRVMFDQRDGSIVNIASIFGLVAASPINEASYAPPSTPWSGSPVSWGRNGSAAASGSTPSHPGGSAPRWPR